MLEVQLHQPHHEFKNQFLSSFQTLESESDRSAWVYLGDGADLSFPENEFEKYVNTLLQRGTQPPPHFVCDTVFGLLVRMKWLAEFLFAMNSTISCKKLADIVVIS